MCCYQELPGPLQLRDLEGAGGERPFCTHHMEAEPTGHRDLAWVMQLDVSGPHCSPPDGDASGQGRAGQGRSCSRRAWRPVDLSRGSWAAIHPFQDLGKKAGEVSNKKRAEGSKEGDTGSVF